MNNRCLWYFKVSLGIVLFSVLSSLLCYAQYPTVEIVELRLDSQHNYNMKYGVTGRVIASPHWTKSGTSEIVFYPKNANVNIDAKFELSEVWGGGYKTLYLRANHESDLEVEGTVTLSNGMHQFDFEQVLNSTAGVITNNKIGGETLDFDWEYSWDDITWSSAGSTSNPCYITFAKPIAPWSTDGYNGIPVYVEIMYSACTAMNGKSTISEALEALPGAVYSYMTYDGSQHFTFYGINEDFHIREFVIRSTPDHGPPSMNDCRDFACFVECLCSAIGISNNEIMHLAPKFFTHWIKPAPGQQPRNTEWNFHVVDFITESPYQKIADASLLLDGDNDFNNGFTGNGILSKYNCTKGQYILKLVLSGSVTDQNIWTTCVLSETRFTP
ncbi:MAG: hypothetical protein JXR73_06635 [Candidatus Omnitrophica bacterium]|nr:hypothetical protein [Candidatus Omnitrophota bacterium]